MVYQIKMNYLNYKNLNIKLSPMCVKSKNTIYGIYIQLTIANTIENKSKNRVQKSKITIEGGK